MAATQSARIDITSFILGTALLIGGCSTTPDEISVLSQEERESLGSVGVIAIGPAPVPEAIGPIGSAEEMRSGATRGLAYGAGGGALGGAAFGLLCGPWAIVCSPVFALAGGAGGAVVGGLAGAVIASDSPLEDDTRQDLEGTLAAATPESGIHIDLANRVQTLWEANASQTVVSLGSVDAPQDENLSISDFVREQGVDGMLETGVAQVALVREDLNSFNFFLMISAYARLSSASSEDPLWVDNQIIFISDPAPFLVWTAVGSNRAETETERGLGLLAERISAIVSGTAPSP